MPSVRTREVVAGARRTVPVCRVRAPNIRDRWDSLSGFAHAAADLVSRDVVVDESEDGRQRLGSATHAGLAQLQNGLDMAAQAATRNGAARDRLTGRVEVDETYIGGVHPRRRGRQTETQALVAVAVQVEGRRLGRIRLRRIPDASAASLMAFVQDAIAPRSLVHTDGWLGYVPLRRHGYRHRVTFLEGQTKSPSQLMPHVHQVVSLLKRWLLGTHHGAVTHEHLDYYLDEFTFRFNRRTSRHRGKLFYRLVQQAVAVDPVPYRHLVGGHH